MDKPETKAVLEGMATALRSGNQPLAEGLLNDFAVRNKLKDYEAFMMVRKAKQMAKEAA